MPAYPKATYRAAIGPSPSPRTSSKSEFDTYSFLPVKNAVIAVDDRGIAAAPGRNAEETVLYPSFVTHFPECPPQFTLADILDRPSFYRGISSHALHAVSAFIVIGFFQK